MAKQIKSPIPNNLFDQAIAGAVNFLAKIDEIILKFKEVGAKGREAIKNIDFGKAEGIAELNKEITKLEKSVDALEKVKKEQVKTETAVAKIRKEEAKVSKQLAGLTDEEVKGKIRFAAANKKQRDELKALVALEDKQVGTLGKLNAANQLLRIERAKLNDAIPEERARFAALNAEIDENNARIDELSDKQKKAKQNVGAYSAGILEAAGSSEALGSASSDLARIQGTLAAVLKIARAALSKNEEQTKDNEKATTRLGTATQKAGQVVKASLLGAVALAASAIGKFITGTQEGQIKFESFTAQVVGGINVIFGRFADLGKAIVLLTDFNLKGAKKAFGEAFRGGLVDDIKKVNVEISQLVKTQFLAANASRAVQVEIERRIQKEEELREIFDDDTRGFRERQAAAAELTKIFSSGNSALSKQSELLAEQRDIARDRALIAIQERAGDKVDTGELRAQISASNELSEVILNNKKLFGENNALIIDPTILDELIDAEKAFVQTETELNSKRLADRQLIAKLLFDEVEQEVDFLIDGTDQIKTNNERIVSSDRETFEERRKVLNETIQLIKDANEAVLVEIAKTAEGVEGADIAQAFSEALNVSDLNTKLKDLGLAEIPINRLLELFREIKTQERDFKDVGEILDEAITGGRDAASRIKILKDSNAGLSEFSSRLLALAQIDTSKLTGDALKAFNKGLEDLNNDIDAANEDRAKSLLELEISQLEERLGLSKAGSAEALQIEEQLLGRRLDLLAIERAETLDTIAVEDKAREDAADKEAKRLKEAAEQREKALGFLENALSANAEKRQKALDEEITSAQNRQQEIQQAIAAGNEGASESLSKARREEEEATAARDQLIEKRKQQEAILTMLKLVSTYAGAGDPNPVGKASRDIVAASSFADALFYEGTERVDQDGQITKIHGGRDGYRIGVDGKERILSGKQNSKIGNLSNEILADVGLMYRTGQLVEKGREGEASALSYAQLSQINKTLKDLPGKMPVHRVDRDLITGIVSEALKRGNNTKKSRPSWS